LLLRYEINCADISKLGQVVVATSKSVVDK